MSFTLMQLKKLYCRMVSVEFSQQFVTIVIAGKGKNSRSSKVSTFKPPTTSIVTKGEKKNRKSFCPLCVCVLGTDDQEDKKR